MTTGEAPIGADADIRVYRYPTPEPEADGTLTWDATTAVTVTIAAGGRQGLGWTYSTAAAAAVITDHLVPAITGRDATDITGCWEAMHRACRNLGTRGLVMQAISAVDIALWDLKPASWTSRCRGCSAGSSTRCPSTDPAASPP